MKLLNEYQIINYLCKPTFLYVIRETLCDRNKIFANGKELINYSILHKEELTEIIDDILEIANTPIYFTVDELKAIQSSNDPFTDEEIEDIMDTELEKKNYMDINCDVVEFCVDWLLKDK